MSKNIRELLLDTVNRNPDGVAIRYKDNGNWLTISYAELLPRVKGVSQMLHNLKFKEGDKIGIQLENCWQWAEVYFGIASAGFIAVPIDPKLGENEVAHIARHSVCRAIIASNKSYPVIREIADGLPDLKTVILVGEKHPGIEKSGGVRFLDYSQEIMATKDDASSDRSHFDTCDPDGEQIASVIYTSGTTGRQKGAMLTHKNFCSNVEACIRSIDVTEDDNFLLVLPLHHVFAFTTNLLLPVRVGAEISLVENLRTVGENIREVSPSALIAVPLLLEKVYNKIWKGLKQKKAAYGMFKLGIKKPIIKGIHKNLGGKLRLVISGGAPASVDVLRGFMDLGLSIVEGYGLTETAPVLTLNPPDAPRPGTVGKPLPGVDIRIINPNENGIGEIAARGDNIMKGYLKDPEATSAIMDGDYLLTGDLGCIDDDGFVTITGRKKSLIVNREGKNIYPEEVEACINKHEFVLESLVLGVETPGQTGERVGLIVVPDQEAIDQRHKHSKKTLSFSDVEKIMKEAVMKQASELAAFKRPRRIQVRMEEFEKTSTKKIKRYLYEINSVDV